MSEKRFTVNELVKFNYSEIGEYVDENHTDRPLRNDEVVDLLNEQQAEIERLKEQLSLVCNAESSSPYNSVKEVLRRQIFGLDCAAEESPNAWHHYRLLSKLFEEQYGEYWDNED